MKFIGGGTIDGMSFFSGVEMAKIFLVPIHGNLGSEFSRFSKKNLRLCTPLHFVESSPDFADFDFWLFPLNLIFDC
jgi:hypothetical protein